MPIKYKDKNSFHCLPTEAFKSEEKTSRKSNKNFYDTRRDRGAERSECPPSALFNVEWPPFLFIKFVTNIVVC